MAAAKKKSYKQGWVSKVINGLLTALTFARPLQLLATVPLSRAIDSIIEEATFGLVRGGGLSSFDLGRGLRMYSPAGAAAGLGFLKRYAMRHFPVRR